MIMRCDYHLQSPSFRMLLNPGRQGISSPLPKKIFNESAVTTLSGSTFQVSVTLRLKIVCLVSVLQYTFFNLYVCPLVCKT